MDRRTWPACGLALGLFVLAPAGALAQRHLGSMPMWYQLHTQRPLMERFSFGTSLIRPPSDFGGDATFRSVPARRFGFYGNYAGRQLYFSPALLTERYRGSGRERQARRTDAALPRSGYVRLPPGPALASPLHIFQDLSALRRTQLPPRRTWVPDASASVTRAAVMTRGVRFYTKEQLAQRTAYFQSKVLRPELTVWNNPEGSSPSINQGKPIVGNVRPFNARPVRAGPFSGTRLRRTRCTRPDLWDYKAFVPPRPNSQRVAHFDIRCLHCHIRDMKKVSPFVSLFPDPVPLRSQNPITGFSHRTSSAGTSHRLPSMKTHSLPSLHGPSHQPTSWPQTGGSTPGQPNLVSYPELPSAPFLLEKSVPVRRTEEEDNPFRPSRTRGEHPTSKSLPASDVRRSERPDPAGSEVATPANAPEPAAVALAPSQVDTPRQRVGSSVVSRPPPLPSLPGDGPRPTALAPITPSRVETPVETLDEPTERPLVSRPPPLPPLPEPGT
jgi:hypothetical protein